MDRRTIPIHLRPHICRAKSQGQVVVEPLKEVIVKLPNHPPYISQGIPADGINPERINNGSGEPFESNLTNDGNPNGNPENQNSETIPAETKSKSKNKGNKDQPPDPDLNAPTKDAPAAETIEVPL